MKNKLIAFLSLTFLLFCAACSASASENPVSRNDNQTARNRPGVENVESGSLSSGNTTRLNENYSDALPVLSQLMVGTLNLETGENAVSVEQAEELLFLWKGIRYLQNNRGTAATAETDGVIEQLQESMTSEQIKAISVMKLTQSDEQRAIQQYGALAVADQESSSVQAGQIRMGAGGRDGGGFPGGGGPPGGGMGGGMMPPGEGFAQGNDNTAGAADAANPRLLNAVIRFLENKLKK